MTDCLTGSAVARIRAMSNHPSVTAHLSQTDRPARRAMPDTTPLTDDELREIVARPDAEMLPDSTVAALAAEVLELRQKLSTARDALAGYHLLIEGGEQR